jgi:hypothetical protein
MASAQIVCTFRRNPAACPWKNLKGTVRSWSLPYVIITIYYNYIIKAEYKYSISDRSFLEECDKQEHLEVTVAATDSC